jgi:small subunit ribosomal protein S19e
MVTVYDVPADAFIKKLAEYLKENVPETTPPAWASFVKTGAHVERTPQDPDWWYVRCASILRKIYKEGPIGVSRLRKDYGGRRGRGTSPGHFKAGGGAIVRKAFQQLEAAGLAKASGEGRVLTRDGRSLLDRLAGKVKRELEKSIPELKKYG